MEGPFKIEVELKLSWCWLWVELFEVNMGFHRVGVWLWFKYIFRSTQVAKQHSFLCFQFWPNLFFQFWCFSLVYVTIKVWRYVCEHSAIVESSCKQSCPIVLNICPMKNWFGWFFVMIYGQITARVFWQQCRLNLVFLIRIFRFLQYQDVWSVFNVIIW